MSVIPCVISCFTNYLLSKTWYFAISLCKYNFRTSRPGSTLNISSWKIFHWNRCNCTLWDQKRIKERKRLILRKSNRIMEVMAFSSEKALWSAYLHTMFNDIGMITIRLLGLHIYNLPNLYIQIDKNTVKMRISYEILGCIIWLIWEIIEISILFWNKVSSMTIHFTCYWPYYILINLQIIRISYCTFMLVFGKYYCTTEIDCIVNWCTGYFSSKKPVKLFQKRTEMHTKKLVFYTFYRISVNLETGDGDIIWVLGERRQTWTLQDMELAWY